MIQSSAKTQLLLHSAHYPKTTLSIRSFAYVLWKIWAQRAVLTSPFCVISLFTKSCCTDHKLLVSRDTDNLFHVREEFQLYITIFQLLLNTLQLNKTAVNKNNSLTKQISLLLRTQTRFIACVTLRNFPEPPKHLVSQFRKINKMHIIIAITVWMEKLISDGDIFEVYPSISTVLIYISIYPGCFMEKTTFWMTWVNNDRILLLFLKVRSIMKFLETNLHCIILYCSWC